MILGIDAGTSLVKAAAFGEGGEDLGVAKEKTTLIYAGNGRVEQDFEEVVAAVGEVVSRVSAGAGEPVEAVGVTGQGDGLWLYDEAGRCVRNAISWLDARGNTPVEKWMQNGVFKGVFRRNANAVFPGSQAALLDVISREEPDALDRARTAGYCKDGVFQRLTGERLTDVSEASLPFLDVTKRDYDDEILRLLGLAKYRHLLAPVEKSPGAMHPMSAEGTALTGISEGTPVHLGPFDLPACALGAGITKPGDGIITIGTTLACQVVVDSVDTPGEPGGMTLCTQEEGRWMRAMPAMVGTASLDLALDLIRSSYAEVERFLASSPPGARGVGVLPFFSASGERAPFIEPRARGRISGMTLSTSRPDIVRAVCESVGYAARHCMERAGLQRQGAVRICGGGADSPAWRQIFADILQRPLGVARRPEVGARGAAIAAAISNPKFRRDYDHEAWTGPEEYVLPNPENSGLYEEGFGRYLDEIETAREGWSKNYDHTD